MRVINRLSPPTPADAYVGVGVTDATMTRLLPLVNAAVVVYAWFTVTPLGFGGRGLYGLVLMVLGTAAMSLRLAPPTAVSGRPRFVVYLVAAVVCGLMFGYDTGSVATAFAPILAGTAGFRFSTLPSLIVASTASVTAFVATSVHFGELQYWPLIVGLAVLIGMTRRDRAETVRLAREKVEQTERAVASESRAQVLAERARVARDIHDVLAHSLSGVNMQLNLADALLEDGRADAGRDAVRTAQALVAGGLIEARRAVHALRDPGRDLVSSIEAMLAGDNESLSVVGVRRPLDADLTEHLVRIVGEALTNARRHAPGAATDITIDHLADRLTVSVINGTSSTTTPFTQGAGVGLVGMRERAAEIGAELRIGPVDPSDPSAGWSITVEVAL